MKKIRNGIIGVVVLGGTFFGGGYVQANNGFMNQILSNAAGEINQATNQKKEEIIDNIENNVAGKLEETMRPVIESKKEESIQELEEYADKKIKDITETDQFSNFESELDQRTEIVIGRHKNAIDEAINNAFYE